MVNENDNPIIVPHQQTYVSQYVELPFRELQNYADRQQQTFDAGEMAEGQMQDTLLKAQALEKDKALRNQLISGYENEMTKNIDATGGDYALAIPKIKEMGRRMHQDFTRGQLGAITSNYAAAAEYNKNLQTKYDKGDITLDQFNGLRGISMQNYKGVQQQLQPNGSYNPFSGIEAANKVDVDKKVEELIKGYLPDGYDGGEYHLTPDGQYRYHTKDGWKQVKAADVHRDVSGALWNDRDVVGYMSQLTDIDAHNAQQSGKKFDKTQALQQRMNQYADRAASKAGFREAYHDTDVFKPDEYALEKFTSGLKFKAENAGDATMYQSGGMSQKNPLTNTEVNGVALSGEAGLQANIDQWKNQGEKAVKEFLPTLATEVNKIKDVKARQEATANLSRLQNLINEEGGILKVYKELKSPGRGGLSNLSNDVVDKIVSGMDGFMNQYTDALQLKTQVERKAIAATGYDPQENHIKGYEKVLQEATALEKNKKLPKGVTAAMVAEAAFPTSTSEWVMEREENRTTFKGTQLQSTPSFLVNKKTGERIELEKSDLNNPVLHLQNVYNKGDDVEGRKRYKKAVSEILNDPKLNQYESGGGPVVNKMPGYVIGPNGQYLYDEEEAIKNTKVKDAYFTSDPKTGELHQGNWIGLDGFVMGGKGMTQGNVIDNVMTNLGLDPSDEEEKTKFLKEARTSTMHLSQMPTLMYNGASTRFFEGKLVYNGKEAVVKIPVTPQNITTTSINQLVNNPAEKIKSTLYDQKYKGLETVPWREHPDVQFQVDGDEVRTTMPNPYYGVTDPRQLTTRQAQEYAKKGKFITTSLDESIPFLTEFKSQKDMGRIAPDYLEKLNNQYFDSQLAPQNVERINKQRLDFPSLENAKDIASVNPEFLKPNTVYRIGDGDKVNELTGQQIMDQTYSKSLPGTQRQIEKEQYYKGLVNQGMPDIRAKFLAESKYGN